ncbi:hypothetical protein SERLA73DRAFT_101986 [Serpula lacrymans var. lacrymans S7.3]|uniref:Phosphodiesterase n=2 Tax=Serpula lacrymans var. lacrymans TaxID=341189 RepID=F8PJA8_SERL3|nr:hypothetical protein SERLA73DRAFT_101986 [Serpula lacrymans var. lacrymans S7.3]
MFVSDDLAHGRRRSVDVGGLALALENQGLGQGWGGWEEKEAGGTRYAELLSDMYTHTQILVNHHSNQLLPFVTLPETRCRLIKSLDNWHFEPHRLPDEEVLSCTLILFETLFRIQGMKEDTGVSLNELSGFLQHLRHIYRGQNSYHNYQHALDVLQASHSFLCAEGVVPPVSILLDGDDRMWQRDKTQNTNSLSHELRNIELFALYVAAIGHDVGHPGLTNVFMKKAHTPLSAVYDDKSALEQMHYALLTQAMRHHGLGFLLDHADTIAWFRKLLSGIILATDMSVHAEFMQHFELLARGSCTTVCERRLLLCQAIIKCADISNPGRPLGVSHYWASALMEEWASQAKLEKHFHLPVSLQPSDTPLDKAKSQIFFIENFAKPLLDLTAQVLPGMAKFARQCTSNLRFWEGRRSEFTANGESGPSPDVDGPVTISQSPETFLSAFPMALPTFFMNHQDDRLVPLDWSSTYTPSERSTSSSDSDSQLIDAQGAQCDSLPSVPTSLSSPISPSDSVGSCLLSPQSEHSVSSQRPVSIASLGSNGLNDSTAVMRAAYQASVRKKKSFHRYSWNTATSALPPPPIPPPALPTTPKVAVAQSVIVTEVGTGEVALEGCVASVAVIAHGCQRPSLQTNFQSII